MDKHEEDVYLAWLSCFEVESNDPLSPFLWGSQDSFNNGAPSSLLCQEELMPRLRGDFIDVVTTISRAYQRDDYLEMKPLDDIAWKAFGSGSIFNVGRSNLQFETVTPMSNQPRKVFNIIVIKRINNWSMTSDKIRSFNRELMILDHLRNEESIVTLRGIGWFYHSENLPSVPEPVIMLEEAFNTLQYVIGKHLPSTTMLRIFHDVAKGLSVLHAHGIVHGDIKIDNVLLFQKKSVEAGVEDDIFVAKLSDFNLAMLDNGGRQYRLGGTSMYMSPESGDYLNFDQLKLTDVYALGVLYALVASDTDNMLSLDVRQLITENTTLDLMEQIILQLNIDMESSTRTPQQIALLFGIFLNSLASNPIDRSLDRVMHCFESYFGDFQSPRPNDTARLIDPSPTDLIISYGKFMSLSGNIKDEITKALIEIASSDENDSRRAKAFFELAVIHCSQYASPWHTATRGLQYLWDAAEHGDLRARALYRRLHQAYRCNVNPEFHSRQVEWLTSAAESGYKIALDELVATGNTTQKKRALERYAISRLQENFKPRLSQDSSWSNQESFVPWPGSPFESLEYMIHLAAATGSSETVVSLIERHHRLLNYRNDSGDTPLLSACRYGQFDVSLTLLRNSADASLTNASGENGLHFLWRFCTSEAQILIVELLQHGANPDQYASLSQSGGDWDLIPNIVSNPIERLVSYNRLDLVKLLIEVGCGIFPRNGNQLRRMLLLAIRLQHVDMQFFLIEYASKQDKDYRQDLAPLDEVQWEYKSRTRSYLDAAVLGWTRQTGQGIDVPLNFWQACCHGADWLTAMKSTVDISLNLTGSSGINQTALDAAIRIAIGEKSYPVFEYLFITKVVLTDGNRNRVKSLYKFCWKEETNGDSEQKSYSLLNLPPKKINYIDQVFHYRKATLAQQAVWKGDRSLFHLCVHRLGADLLLPFKTRHHKKLGQFNCYVGIALSEHQDIWFADQLHNLGISVMCPYQHGSKVAVNWQHPLCHALQRRSRVLASWLIDIKGCSVLDNIGHETTVLETLLDWRKPSHSDLEFIFPTDDPKRSITWSMTGNSGEKYGPLEIFHATFNFMSSLRLQDHSALPELAYIWLKLLQQYPYVENRPLSPVRAVERYGQHHIFCAVVYTIKRFLNQDTATKHWISPRHPMRAKFMPPCNMWGYYDSLFGMTMYLCKERFLRYHRSSGMSFDLFIAPTLLARIHLGQDQEGHGLVRVDIPPAIEEDTNSCSRPQPWYMVVSSLFSGSPMDEISLRLYWSSGLYKYLHFPSIWHPRISITLVWLSAIIMIIGAAGLVIWIWVRSLLADWRIAFFRLFELILAPVVLVIFISLTLFLFTSIIYIIIGLAGYLVVNTCDALLMIAGSGLQEMPFSIFKYGNTWLPNPFWLRDLVQK